MKAYLPLMLLASMTSGCSFLGLYRIEKAERAPPEEAATVRFPDSMEEGIRLSGPTLAALRIALDDFIPPGSEFTSEDPDQRVAACLSRRSTYETLLLPREGEAVFVAFVPDLKRCGLNEEILDGGAVYAIDAKGRILDRR
ncbi:hypothetical protein [Melittangium boletus]|uniref:Putative lipoprotein n=1 Tax=Melittangium boletus DSM 14713 TaxID=1294270 RepID=A0A250IFB9_9BACT|nr:hypothetical protein [Melittangium boletus]ATB29933.1 putative lipoprotein [Melittangium boletus DSM 14713]